QIHRLWRCACRGSAVPGVKLRWSSLRKAPWGRRTTLTDWQSQAHLKWDCKDPGVIRPKSRRKVISGRLRRGIGPIRRDRCRPKDLELVEGKAMPDQIPLLWSVPPRFSIAMTIGYLQGKSATRIHRELRPTKGPWFGLSFWAGGYGVRTVGRDDDQIRRYLRDQGKLQRNLDQSEWKLDYPTGPFQGPSSYHRFYRWF